MAYATVPDPLRQAGVLVLVVAVGRPAAKQGWLAWLWGVVAGLAADGIEAAVVADYNTTE